MGTAYEGLALRTYRESLASIKPVDRAIERDLAARWAEGDKRAGEQLVEACLPFVMSIAFEYRRWGVPLEDIIQQGNLGLLKAAAKFDLTKNCRLATYAAYWIRAEIREYVVRAYRVVRLGTTKAERKALRAYRKTNESDETVLSQVSGLSKERLAMLMPLLTAREVSLDAAANDGGTPADKIAARGPSPEDEAGTDEVRSRAAIAIRAALEDLSDRERTIVEERLMTEEPLTLQEIGDRWGVSKERVRQIEERARGKLRTTLGDFRELALAM